MKCYRLVHLTCPQLLYIGKSKKSFSAVLFIHRFDYLFHLGRKQTVIHLPTPPENVTTLTSELQNFFHLTQGLLPSVLWRCWLGGRKGIRPVKTEWWGAGVVICLERGADLQMAQMMPLPLTVSCFSKIQIGFTFLVLAHPSSPGQRAIKRVCEGLLRFFKCWRLWREPVVGCHQWLWKEPVVMCSNWNVWQAMSQQVFTVTTFCINTCFQSFLTLICRTIHHAVLKFSPCPNKPLPQASTCPYQYLSLIHISEPTRPY